MALAAVAAGADGLTVEVHPDPDHALSDGPQSLYPQQFEKLMRDIEVARPGAGQGGRPPARARPRGPGRAAVGGRRGAGGASRRVAFQGERGAFSEHAVLLPLPGRGRRRCPCRSSGTCSRRCCGQRSATGIVPVENSLTGSIHQNYDLLLQYPDVRIVGEQKIRIVHNLIGLPGTRLAGRSAGSTPTPRHWRSAPRSWTRHPAGSASLSTTRRAPCASWPGAGDRENAAIASEEAARVHGLAVLRQGHRDQPAELHAVRVDRSRETRRPRSA